MISLRLKLSIYILIGGFFCGFCMAFFFIPPCPVQTKNLPASTKELNKQVNSIEKDYKTQITVLQNQNIDLQQQLTTTQSLLERAKQSTKQKETAIKKLVKAENMVSKNWSFQNYSIPLFDEPPPCSCDSLKKEVTSYISENHRKDSIYEVQLETKDSVISVKDSIIHINEGVYNSLHEVFNQAVTDNQVLQSENRLLIKKEKRRKVKNRLLSAGILIISGSFIHFIHH